MINQELQLFNILIGRNILDAGQAERLQHEYAQGQSALGQLLQNLSVLQENQYISLLVKEAGYHYLNLDNAEIDPEAVRELPVELAKQLGVIPVRKARGTLAVAMNDPFNPPILNRLKEATPHTILPVLSRRQEIERALERYQTLSRKTSFREVDWGIPLVARFTFENFVVSKSNEFACAMSQAVAKSPGENYNPLFLYSDVGLGKTHLLNAIGNFLLQRKPGAQLFYATCEYFNNKVVEAIKDNQIDEFRSIFSALDLLLIDDIEFLSGRDRTQEEFFHLFNRLIQGNKQIVVTSDRPPSELAVLEKRLRSRFMGGTVANIDPPELDTRIAILKKKSQQTILPPEVLQLIASKIMHSVRELEGALNTILSLNRFTQEKITLDMAERVIKEMGY